MLAAVGTLSYGLAVFDAFVKSSIDITPQWDDAQRTITDCEIEIKVKAYVYNAAGTGSTDAQATALYQQLTTPCQTLKYTQKGFGGQTGTGLVVNGTDGGPQDVAYGPKPKLASFVPLGGSAAVGNVAAIVEWSVTTRIPMCPDATFMGNIMAFNYDASFSIDGATGMTRVDWSGYLEIPVTRGAGTRQILDNADSYRERLAAPVAPGWRRVNQEFKLDKSKRRLDFSWTDQEIPYPFQTNLTDEDAEEVVTWQRANLPLFTGRISARMTVAPDQPKTVAIDRFKTLVASRLGQGKDGKIAGVGKNPDKSTTFLDGIEIRESILTNTWNFAATFRIIGTSLDQIFKITNIAAPIKDLSWSAWINSLNASAFNIRGIANARFVNAMDNVIDLCLPGLEPPDAAMNTGAVSKLQTLPPAGPVLKAVDKPPQIAGVRQARQFVDPDASWVAYQVAIEIDEDDRLAVHKPLNAANTVATNQDSSGSAAGGANDVMVGAQVENAATSVSAKIPDVIQRLSAPTYKIRLSGRAIRLGYRIPTPRLVTVGGVTVTQRRDNSREGQMSAVGGVPFYWKVFEVEYICPSTPNALPLPANPAFDLLGDGGTGK
jgi:hypothetical protein